MDSNSLGSESKTHQPEEREHTQLQASGQHGMPYRERKDAPCSPSVFPFGSSPYSYTFPLCSGSSKIALLGVTRHDNVIIML